MITATDKRITKTVTSNGVEITVSQYMVRPDLYYVKMISGFKTKQYTELVFEKYTDVRSAHNRIYELMNVLDVIADK